MSVQTICRAAIPSPLGDLTCAATDSAVVMIMYTPGAAPEDSHVVDGFNPILERLRNQLREYFAGTRRDFDIPAKLSGTPHQCKVWNALQEIPYGETASYQRIAQTIGSAPIAVGQANGRNRVNILIPCHRVIGADGSLTGYGGGLDRKRYLLDLERKYK